MIEKDKVIAFVNYNYQPKKKKQLFSGLLLVQVFCIPCALLGSYALFTTILLGVFDLFFIAFFFKLLLLKTIPPKEQNLFEGIQMLYISIILMFASYKIAMSEKPSSIFKLFIIVIFFVLGSVLLNYVLYRNIKRGSFLKGAPNNRQKITAFSTAGAAVGILFARMFLKSMNQEAVVLFVSILTLIIAVFMSSGCVLLQKYYWQRKLNLDGKDKMISKPECISLVTDCFKKAGASPPVNLKSLNLNLEEVDTCLDCVSDIFCREGLEKDDEPNTYGLQLEEVINCLLHIRYILIDSEGNKC